MPRQVKATVSSSTNFKGSYLRSGTFKIRIDQLKEFVTNFDGKFLEFIDYLKTFVSWGDDGSGIDDKTNTFQQYLAQINYELGRLETQIEDLEEDQEKYYTIEEVNDIVSGLTKRITELENKTDGFIESTDDRISDLQTKVDKIKSCECQDCVSQEDFNDLIGRVDTLEYQCDCLDTWTAYTSKSSEGGNLYDKLDELQIRFDTLDGEFYTSFDYVVGGTGAVDESNIFVCNNVRECLQTMFKQNGLLETLWRSMINVDETLSDVYERTKNYYYGTIICGTNKGYAGISYTSLPHLIDEKLMINIPSDTYGKSLDWNEYKNKDEVYDYVNDKTEEYYNERRQSLKTYVNINEDNIATLQVTVADQQTKLEDVRGRTCNYHTSVIISGEEEDGELKYYGYDIDGILKHHYSDCKVAIPSDAYDKYTSESNPFKAKWYLADNPTKLRSYIITNGKSDYE